MRFTEHSRSEIEAQIEAYLLERHDWVPAHEIAFRFGVRERQLRALDDQPGLCTLIAISGDKGYKHIFLASTTEWERYAERETKIHGSALDHLHHKEHLRQNATREIKRPALVLEKDSGQALMSGVLEGAPA